MSESVKLTKLSECGGCGAKVGAGELRKLLNDLPVREDPDLIVGFDKSDDASVYRVSDELAIVQTVDFFPPIVDDPFLFGQIAAANALSDIYAMGGIPKTALNIMAVPENMPKDQIREILKGGYTKVYEAGAVITGGHSIYDNEPKYGLAVTGFVDPGKILKNCCAVPGDALIYTKPLGTGVMLNALKGELVSEKEVRDVIENMTVLNKATAEILSRFMVHSCTDVTGFGLLGHSLEMAEGSGVSVELFTDKISFYQGADEFAKLGLLPKGMYRNRHFAEHAVDHGSVPLYLQDLLYDPQTSGGLLAAVREEDADCIIELMKKTDGIPCPAIIGRVTEKLNDKHIILR